MIDRYLPNTWQVNEITRLQGVLHSTHIAARLAMISLDTVYKWDDDILWIQLHGNSIVCDIIMVIELKISWTLI